MSHSAQKIESVSGARALRHSRRPRESGPRYRLREAGREGSLLADLARPIAYDGGLEGPLLREGATLEFAYVSGELRVVRNQRRNLLVILGRRLLEAFQVQRELREFFESLQQRERPTAIGTGRHVVR